MLAEAMKRKGWVRADFGCCKLLHNVFMCIKGSRYKLTLLPGAHGTTACYLPGSISWYGRAVVDGQKASEFAQQAMPFITSYYF